MSALAILMIAGAGGIAGSALIGLLDGTGARRAGSVLATLGSLGVAAAGVVAIFGHPLVWQPFTWYPFGRGGVQIDGLAGLFLLLTGLVAAPLFVAAGHREPGVTPMLRGLLVLTVIGVVVVDNVFGFLILYELTVIVIYGLISARHDDPRAQPAAALTLTLAKLGGGSVLGGMVLLAVQAGSFSFEQLAHSGPQLSSAVRGVCFALLFAGFAVKAALIPVQTWLPAAYAESDADSSGFVAAVSLNIAFYAMLRVWFGFLGHPAVWWAVVTLLVGALRADRNRWRRPATRAARLRGVLLDRELRTDRHRSRPRADGIGPT